MWKKPGCAVAAGPASGARWQISRAEHRDRSLAGRFPRSSVAADDAAGAAGSSQAAHERRVPLEAAL